MYPKFPTCNSACRPAPYYLHVLPFAFLCRISGYLVDIQPSHERKSLLSLSINCLFGRITRTYVWPGCNQPSQHYFYGTSSNFVSVLVFLIFDLTLLWTFWTVPVQSHQMSQTGPAPRISLTANKVRPETIFLLVRLLLIFPGCDRHTFRTRHNYLCHSYLHPRSDSQAILDRGCLAPFCSRLLVCRDWPGVQQYP